ncbi:MAG TPA: hypothetical protein VHL77_02195 [Ferruginibacter sp.]|jgi:hypothetical protein|nr:hypothetical protein [Ferruginibacter sp.]
MMNPGSPEFKHAGEHIVEQWLKNNGYTNVSRETLQSTEIAIKAIGTVENILVQVRTFLHPQRPFKLSDYEIDILTRRAARMQLVAYAAYVVLNENEEVVDEINWERVS